jgi:hypothetical protein
MAPRSWRYGYDLMKGADLSSGTLVGWVSTRCVRETELSRKSYMRERGDPDSANRGNSSANVWFF